MTTKPKAKKAPVAKPEPPSLAEQVEAVADSLHPLHNLDEVAHQLQGISYELQQLAEAAAMQIIVTHGDDLDRQRIVEYLKRKHYEAFEA